MKVLIVILAISAIVFADEPISVRGAISDQLLEAAEKLRIQMPCGFPKYGIPPLAPLKIEHKELAVKTDAISVEGEVNKARVDGLDKFEIHDLKINVIFSKFTGKLKFPSIVVKSLYDLETVAKAYGFTIDVKGLGNIYMELKDLAIDITAKYSIIKGIKLKSLRIIPSIGEVDSKIDGILGHGFGNRKMNELLEEMILIGLNDNANEIADYIEATAVPIVNDALEGYTLADIIGSIGGGGGGEPTVCIPPEDN